MTIRTISRTALALATLAVAATGFATRPAQATPPLPSQSSGSSYNPDIPEPGTYGLLVAGGAVAAGHILARRRKLNGAQE